MLISIKIEEKEKKVKLFLLNRRKRRTETFVSGCHTETGLRVLLMCKRQLKVKVKTMTLALTLTWCGTLTVFMAIILTSLFFVNFNSCSVDIENVANNGSMDSVSNFFCLLHGMTCFSGSEELHYWFKVLFKFFGNSFTTQGEKDNFTQGAI